MGFGTEFVIPTILARLKSYLDLVETRSQYNDAWLLNDEIGVSIPDVLQRVEQASSAVVLNRYAFSLAAGTRRYAIPPSIRSVTRLIELDAEGNDETEYLPRNELHANGYGWKIEGNDLVLQFDPDRTGSMILEYIHNGDVAMHHGNGELLSTSTFRLAATPTLGDRDLRPGAYTGQMLRIKSGTGMPIYEYMISDSAYVSGTNWNITTHDSITADLSLGSFDYEIVPWANQPLWELIVLRAALRLAGKLSVTQKKYQMLQMDYNSALKTAAESLQLMQGRRPPHWETEGIGGDSFRVIA